MELVPNRETCEILQLAGFPQETEFFWSFEGDDEWRIDNSSYYYDAETDIAAPTLGEIPLPDDYYIVKENGFFNVKFCGKPAMQGKINFFAEEIEARAALWLYLNRK